MKSQMHYLLGTRVINRREQTYPAFLDSEQYSLTFLRIPATTRPVWGGCLIIEGCFNDASDRLTRILHHQ